MSRRTHPKITDRDPTPSASPTSKVPPQLPIRSQGAPPRRPGVGYSLRFSKRSLPLGKQFTKKRRRNTRSIATAEIIEFQGSKFVAERLPPPIKALNPTQGDYLDALSTSQQVVVLGPAGTGKTWIAAPHAADLYRSRRTSKIILTRPNVPCGRSLGYFPGSLEDKFAPWVVPVVEAIKDRIGAPAYDIALKRGHIEMG